jgi:hypothetical protein
LFQHRIIMMLEKMVEWWLVGKTEVLGENLSQCRFIHHKPHMLCLDANPSHRGGKPATNRLSYGTALCCTNCKSSLFASCCVSWVMVSDLQRSNKYK